jgi:hypothetical protein
MTRHHELEGVVRSWLREEGHEDADRVLDMVLAELDTTPQRRASRLARRLSRMSSHTFRFGFAAVAVIALVVLGWRFLPVANIGGTEPTGTATASPSPIPTPEPSEFVIAQPYLPFAEVRAPVRTGWEQRFNFVSRDDDVIGFSAWSTDGVYADPCHWEGSLVEIEPSDEAQFFATLTNQPNREPSDMTSLDADSSGTGWGTDRVELSVPANLDLTTCDQGLYNAWTDESDPEPPSGNWNHQPGQTDIVMFVDVDRHSVVIHAWMRAGATPTDRAELDDLIEAIQVGFPEDFESAPSD